MRAGLPAEYSADMTCSFSAIDIDLHEKRGLHSNLQWRKDLREANAEIRRKLENAEAEQWEETAVSDRIFRDDRITVPEAQDSA